MNDLIKLQKMFFILDIVSDVFLSIKLELFQGTCFVIVGWWKKVIQKWRKKKVLLQNHLWSIS